MKSIPWIPNLAFDYLKTITKPSMSVFEYGSGGSTLYFSENVSSLVSIEHDLKWYEKVKSKIGSNVDYKLIAPDTNIIGSDKSNPVHYISGAFAANFKQYVSSIDNYDKFDIIFIDGRSRASCLMHVSKKVRMGGWVILDNYERDYYLAQTSHLFEHWESVIFFGYGPYINWPWKTLFMRKYE